MKKVFVLFSLMFLLISVSVMAVDTGNLKGKVFESESMGLLANVKVTIQSPALMVASMERTTGEDGSFRFPSIPIGKYMVTFQLEGFKQVVRKDIIVSVSSTTNLDIILETSPIQETVEVTGKTPTVDRQSTTTVAILDQNFLKQMPATRDIGTYFNMVPGVTGSTSHGGSERDNTYNLDGVNVTDPVTGTQAGGFSMDIVEELAVQTGGITAEQGSVRGAMVNVVTKSGGSKLSGMASIYYRAKGLQGTNTGGTVFEGVKSGFDYEVEPGINLGGPLVKNKVWFFINGSFMKTVEYVAGFPYDKTESAPYKTDRPYPYLKLTFQLNPDNKLVLSYNFSDLKRNNRGASTSNTEDTTWIQTTPMHTFNIQFSRFFSPDFSMNIKGGAMFYQLNLKNKNELPNYYDLVTQLNSGSYGYDDLYKRNRLQFLTDFTRFVDGWLGGDHEFKAGIEMEYSWDSRQFISKYDPNTGLGPFFNTRNGVPYYVIYYQNFTREDKKLMIGGYIQDSWTLFDRLNLNIGFRYDMQKGIIPAQGTDRTPVEYNGVTYDPQVYNSFTPFTWNTISPRVGITYDITNDGKTVLKAHFGRYYIANILQFFVYTNPNAFLTYYYMLNPDWTANGSKFNFSAQAGTQVDPNLKSPYTDELNVGIERELFKDIRLGVRYIRKWDRKLLEDVDQNALDYNALMSTGELIWTNYTPVTATDPYDGSTVTFYNRVQARATNLVITNPPGANRDYKGLEFTLEKRFSNNWQMSASYVYAKSTGLIGTEFNDSHSGTNYYNDPNYHINALGNFYLERRNQVKVQALWRGPWGINFSGYYRLLGGLSYQRQVRAIDLLGANLRQGARTINVEARGSRKYPDLSILDLRMEKMFRFGKVNLYLFADCFNALNINTATEYRWISSSYQTINGQRVYFGEATGIYSPPRIFRLGSKIEF